MKSHCCLSTMKVHTDGNGSIGSTYYYVCLTCLNACDPTTGPYKPLPIYKKKSLSDDEVLLEGIKEQNEKYNMAIQFIKSCKDINISLNYQIDEFLRELGE